MRTAWLAALLGAVGLCFGTANARADTTDPATPAAAERKSPGLAAALAGGAALVGYGTVAGLAKWADGDPLPVTVGAAALGLFGPAAGHVYVGRNPHHAVGFAFARVGSLAVGFLGLKELMVNDDGQTRRKANEPLGWTLVGVALAGVAGSTVWEAIDSYKCAQVTHGPQERTVALSPFLLPSSTGAIASAGLMLSGSI